MLTKVKLNLSSAVSVLIIGGVVAAVMLAQFRGGKPPRPPSPVISGIEWAPVSSIRRAAQGSDNWPLTWADDGALYTAYGDGNGFEPQLPDKLSLGFARIDGGPADFAGTNIRSPSGEQYGDGGSGRKASGMLMVAGVLYMWVRNANNSGEQCQLAWSRDRGSTWEWANWIFGDFGYCVFINFGRNYSGARDDYVYMVTPDGPSAYEAADHFVLTRVQKSRIHDRGAYEFFVERGSDERAVWSEDVADRGAVFTHTGNSRRSGISYNAGLGRYLWWQILGEDSPRFEGGFGIYDAPEPWGPWTTVFFTEHWDVGPGDAASFPTKWMSEDGTRAALVFSGNDAFSVREMTFLLAEAE
jgi:hypothetical protein